MAIADASTLPDILVDGDTVVDTTFLPDTVVVDPTTVPNPVEAPVPEETFSPLPPVMINYARFDAAGRYYATGTAPSDSPTLQEPDVYVGKVDVETQYHQGNGPADMPAKPAPEYHFNYNTKQWEGDIEKLRAQRHKEIEEERDRRLNDPVLNYDGMLVDADALSKQNLQDKVTATASRISKKKVTPVQMLVWKDHNNVMHSWPDLQSYKDWLDGFVIALEERGMAIWSWSWQMKDQLNALQTFEEVLNFTVAPTPVSPSPTAAPTPAPAPTAMLPTVGL